MTFEIFLKNVSAKQITTSQLQNKYHCKYKLDTINLLLFLTTIFHDLPLINWFGTTNFCEKILCCYYKTIRKKLVRDDKFLQPRDSLI